jgi:hypothetical protein
MIMTPPQPSTKPRTPEQTGVTDVRRAREAIARQHGDDLAEHVSESNRIADTLREKLKLGPVVQPPPRRKPRSGTEG